MIKKLLLTMCAALTLTACAPDIFDERSSAKFTQATKDANLIQEANSAAEALMTQSGYLQNQLRPILVTSIVDISDLNNTSNLGLVISEHIGNRFAQSGFPIVDVRAREDIAIREQSGEFALSRDIKKLSESHAGSAILVGTYAPGSNEVYVSTRLIRPADDRVIATYSFSLPMGSNTKKLLRN